MILGNVLAGLSETMEIRYKIKYLFTNMFIFVVHINLFYNTFSFF